MISRTDLYIEKLIAKMNLDDAQRVEVERELRAHLEEAVQSGVAAGLTRDRAEEEACARFGEPSVLADMFGRQSGTAWLVAERFVLATLTLWMCTLSVQAALTPMERLVTVVLGVIAVVYFQMSSRFEVNGTLRICRPFKKTVSIPFGAIKRVARARGHLFGAAHYVVEYDGGKALLNPTMRNYRCALVALEALAPREALVGLEKLEFAPSRPSALLRCLLSIGWAVVLAMYFVALPPLWQLQGIGVPAALAGALFAALLFIDLLLNIRNLSANYGKSITSCILLAAGFLLLVWLGLSFLLGAEPVRRWAVIAFGVLAALSMILIWWNGKARDLVLTVLAVLCGLWVLRSAMIHSWPYPNTPYAFPTCIRQAVCLGGGTPMYAALGRSTADTMDAEEGPPDTLFFLPAGPSSSAKHKQLSIGPGNWAILGEYSTGTLALACYQGPGKSAVISLASAESGLKKFRDLPPECTWKVRPMPFLSPNRTYVVAPLTTNVVTSASVLAIADLRSGRLTRFDRFEANKVCHWQDDEHLLVLRADQSTARSKAPLSHELWVLNVRTGEETLRRRFVIGDGTRAFMPCSGGRYVNTGDSLVSLESDAVMKYPGGVACASDVAPEVGRVALVSGEGGKDRLVILAASGEQGSCNLPLGAAVTALRIDPRGEKVFVRYTERPDLGLPSGTVAVFDARSGKLSVIERLPYMCGGSNLTAAANAPMQWSRDGTAIYPAQTIVRTGSKLGLESIFRVIRDQQKQVVR